MGDGRSRIRGWSLGALALLGAATFVYCGSEGAPPVAHDAAVLDVLPARDVPQATDLGGVRVWPIPDNAPRVTLETFPRIDGSTSTLPLSRVIACELLGIGYRWEPYAGPEEESTIVPVAAGADAGELERAVRARIVHSRTHEAYVNLIEGSREIILVANPPSPEEAALAQRRGVTLVVRDIALDALVILANAANTVRGLTSAQVRGIFAGEVRNWREVGGVDGTISPYVRPENSGSQQLMNTIVMAGTAMGPWPEDRRPTFMGALVDLIVQDQRSIGYSVFYYVTYQYPVRGFRVLAVDGVEPTVRSIETRAYPFTAPVLAVVRGDLAPTSLAYQLRDWLLTPEGQATVSHSGYVRVSR